MVLFDSSSVPSDCSIHTENSLNIIRGPHPNTLLTEAFSGIIYEKDSKEVLCKSVFNVIPFDSELMTSQSVFSFLTQQCYLGSIVRVYWHDHKWCVSTKKNIDATRIMWHNQNLGKICLDHISGHELVKTYCYTFLIPDKMMLINKPFYMYHVGTIDLQTLKQVKLESPLSFAVFTDWTNTLPRNNDELINTWDKLVSYVNDLPLTVPGILIKHNVSGIVYYMKNRRFEKYEELVGKDKNLVYSLIGLHHLDRREELLEYYPNLQTIYDNDIDAPVSAIADKVFDLYQRRFVGKVCKDARGRVIRSDNGKIKRERELLVTSQDMHTILQHLNKEYYEHKSYGINAFVTKETIIKRIWIYSPLEIFRLIGLYNNSREAFFKSEPFSQEALTRQREQGAVKKIKSSA